MVELTALMRYGNQEAEYSCYAHIYPPVKTPRERLEAELLNEVSKADEKSIHEDTLSLPRQVDGRSVSWASQEGGEGIVLIMLVPAAALAVFWQRDKRLEKLEQQRKNQLILDYPDLLFKLTMLLGAGMTIKGAFVKIASEYSERRSRQARYVYEEMLVTCRAVSYTHLDVYKRQSMRYIRAPGKSILWWTAMRTDSIITRSLRMPLWTM